MTYTSFSQKVDFNVRYNFTECHYEVYFRPDFSASSDYDLGTSQVVIVAQDEYFGTDLGISNFDIVSSYTYNGSSASFQITQVGRDTIPPTGTASNDLFIAFDSNGITVKQSDWVAGQEVLMFSFKLNYSNSSPTICQEGLRLHITGSDNQNPGDNGDYNNSAQDGTNSAEMYNVNYASGTTLVNDNTVDFTVTCTGTFLILNSTTTVNGCGMVTYAWTGPNGWTSTTEDPLVSDPVAGTYKVVITDKNGCTAEKSVDVNATNCSILPVELTSFDVEKSDETSLVSWSTASEINNDYFNVERSKDGVRFETIGTVQGNGTTTDRMTYSFEDENPMGGVNYYRLKQVDYDGAYEYSDIKNVRFDSRMSTNVTMGLYPNPANDYVSIELDGIKLDSKTMVRVFDKIGKLVLVQDVDASNQLNISELADGMYMIQAVNNDSVIATKKLVKTSSF